MIVTDPVLVQHVGSADPKAPPIIDPHYFEKDIGKLLSVAHGC